MDIIFVIDSSGSIRNDRFSDVMQMLANLVDKFEIASDRTRIGAIKWSDKSEIQFHLNTYSSKQVTSIGSTSYTSDKSSTL